MKNQMGQQNVRVALISTYDDMAKIFERLALQAGLDSYVAIATLEKAAVIAKEISSETDVIISRGGTAEYIKQVVDIPVVSIPITLFDVIHSVYEMKCRIHEIAFFNYREKMYGIRDIEKMFDVKIHEYTFISEQDIKEGLKDARSKGIKTALGGILVHNLADSVGLEGCLIKCGEEAMHLSIREAVHLAQVRRKEQNHAAQIRGVLESINEGIIVTDEQNRVVIYNAAAERIFKIPNTQVLGQHVQEVIPNTRMHKVFASGQPEIAVLQQINGGNIATTRIPLMADDGKPIGVVSTFDDVTEIQRLEQQIRKQIHSKGFIAKSSFDDILTVNPRMLELKTLAALYATTDSAVLIEGESGTGKELFAQSIHNASKHASGPFVAVNCAAIPEHLLESELFGYEGGAFTGARKEGKQGLFELAHNGTIFLDEIGEIQPSLQARLLRVLQEKEIMRVGGDKIIPVNIRIISATNKNMEKRVELGEYRSDLYYRLNVFNLLIPPLRERREDIPLLAKSILSKIDNGINIDKVDQTIKHTLMSYDWPGNVRELHNVMERLALLAKHSNTESDWSCMLQKVMVSDLTNDMTLNIQVNVGDGLKDAVTQAEKAVVKTMMVRYDRNQEQVAKLLRIGRTTLWRLNKE